MGSKLVAILELDRDPRSLRPGALAPGQERLRPTFERLLFN
jgi:hypothetical protein